MKNEAALKLRKGDVIEYDFPGWKHVPAERRFAKVASPTLKVWIAPLDNDGKNVKEWKAVSVKFVRKLTKTERVGLALER